MLKEILEELQELRVEVAELKVAVLGDELEFEPEDGEEDGLNAENLDAIAAEMDRLRM